MPNVMSEILFKRLFEVNILHDYHLISADGDDIYQGPGKIKVTINGKFAIATCTVKPDTDVDVRPAFVERADVDCHIKSKKEDSNFYEGFGGFTVTPSGNVIARCKGEALPPE